MRTDNSPARPANPTCRPPRGEFHTVNHRFRAGALLLLVLVLAAPAGGQDPGDGFRPIFDGRTLAGWDGDPRFWSVQDGCVTGQTTKQNPTKGNTFLVWRAGEVDDFEMTFEY